MKIMIGLSGGVDSAVAAYLLKKQGYEVVAGFMRNWDSMLNNDILGNPNNPTEHNICPQEEDYLDAKKVADALKIPLYRIDFVKEYWDNVFEYFIREYKEGRTPNPDVLCNKYIKFDYFLKFAKSLGCDMIATGHYAKKVGNKLFKAHDLNKDQTYFLSLLNQEQIDSCLFPLGDLTKPEVRKIAEQLNLAVASKKDSTGVCFIGERNFRQFLQNYIPAKEGDIVELPYNKVIGKHIGCMYYTIGQRRGLGIGGISNHKSASYFVVDKDVKNNILFVSQEDETKYLFHCKVLVKDVNFLIDKPFDVMEMNAKFRYRQPDNKIRMKFINDSTVEVECYESVKAITVGQICVFYLDDRMIGGGIIDKVYD